jgi:hypothetical protein
MKTLCAFSFTVLLAIGSGTVSHAGQERLSPTWGCACPLERSAAASRPGEDKLLMVIIYKIDHQQGVMELDSELGILQAHALPIEIKDLHVGEKVLVQVTAEVRPHSQDHLLRPRAQRPLLQAQRERAK